MDPSATTTATGAGSNRDGELIPVHTEWPASGPCINDHRTAFPRRRALGWVGKVAVAVTAAVGGLVQFYPTTKAQPTCDIFVDSLDSHCIVDCVGYCSSTYSYCYHCPYPYCNPARYCAIYCGSFCSPARVFVVCYGNGTGYCWAQYC
jgi:hypothetical protein